LEDNTQEIELLVDNELKKNNQFSGCSVAKIEKIVGDAGTRRYYRIYLKGGQLETVILVFLTQGEGPVGGGPNDLTQDQTFVELQSFFSSHSIPVPKLYINGIRKEFLILEDVGNIALWHLAKGESGSEVESILSNLNNNPVLTVYRKAIDLISRIQTLPMDSNCIAFQREMTFERYREEIKRFYEFVAHPNGMKNSEREVLHKVYDAICESIMSHTKALSHFDYMSYNIFVRNSAELVLIDFQDACLTSPVRDLIALINDRDIDTALGNSLNTQLIKYFLQKLKPEYNFIEYYDEYLFHWE